MSTIKIKKKFLTNILLLIAVVVIVSLSYYVITIGDELREFKAGYSGSDTSAASQNPGTESRVAKIMAEVPKEGSSTGYGITFSEKGLDELVSDYKTIALNDAEEKRYIEIGNMKDIACEYCCGIGENGMLFPDGSLACGCGHNIALAGLNKLLVQKGYTEEQILSEIQKWKAYFFTQDYVEERMAEEGVSPEALGLPVQKGGC